MFKSCLQNVQISAAKIHKLFELQLLLKTHPPSRSKVFPRSGRADIQIIRCGLDGWRFNPHHERGGQKDLHFVHYDFGGKILQD